MRIRPRPRVFPKVRHAGLLLILTACEPAAIAEQEARPAVRPVEATDKPKPPPPTGPLQVEWGNVKTTPGCFYFSGPDGRDDTLVGAAVIDRAGTDLTITIAGVAFRGVIRDGELVVTRTSSHDYGGAWTVTETIRGRFVEGALRGKYHYNECEARAARCPGICVIDADLALR